MLSRKNTLKNAAWILIMLGIIETSFFIYAIQTKTSFSGGAFLYIIIGLFILKKDKTAYKITQFIFTMMVLAVPSILLLYLIIFFQVVFSSDISVSYSLFGYGSLYTIIYFGVACYLVMLLHHPTTRKELSLNEYVSNINTLFIPIKRFMVIPLVLFGFSALIAGPTIYPNPYKKIVNGISKDSNVYSKVGNITSLNLLRTNTHNWTNYSYWEVNGEKGKGVFFTKLDTESNLNIEEYGRKKNHSDCNKPNSKGQNASLKHKSC